MERTVQNVMQQLAYTRRGNGFPLVLVHGYLGSAEVWRHHLPTLSINFDVIAPNLAGFGASNTIEAPETIAGFATQVLDLLDHLGIEQFHLLGHSMGGMIVQEMARMAPSRIQKLVCFGTGPVGVLPNRFEPIERSRQRLREDGLAATADRIAATWFVDGEDAPDFYFCRTIALQTSMQAALASLSAWEAWDGTDALPSIEAQTLVLWGDRDRSYGWSQPEALWKGIPGATLAVAPNCGHNVHMENSRLFSQLIDDFLADTMGRSVRTKPSK